MVSLEYFKLLLDYKIYAYCIMPDHLHLIIHPIGKNNISYIMQMIKGSFSRKINKMNLSSGRIWQKRFYDTIIRNEGMLLDKMEYIHTNPLRKGLVLSPEQYEYSSYRFYTENRKNILDLDRLIL